MQKTKIIKKNTTNRFQPRQPQADAETQPSNVSPQEEVKHEEKSLFETRIDGKYTIIKRFDDNKGLVN
jgi:hypothetical protein